MPGLVFTSRQWNHNKLNGYALVQTPFAFIWPTFKCYFTFQVFEKLRGNFYTLVLADTKSLQIGSTIPTFQTGELRRREVTQLPKV